MTIETRRKQRPPRVPRSSPERKAALAAALADMEHDAEYQAKAVALDAELSEASWEALQIAEAEEAGEIHE